MAFDSYEIKKFIFIFIGATVKAAQFTRLQKLECFLNRWENCIKESGLGREGGHEGLEAILESQYVSIGMD
ncbi:hypothetical protein [Sporosarcina jiandibaonis]|uniref:hypothetical protein n=1 Tax=Sporosarcina jiandibaonis TaxID=2715535 RepID=UPI00155190E4|nr:hypothetical protein [Sporosarcina jiandibaonis]